MNRIIDEVLDLIYPKNLYCICCGDLIHQSREYGLCDECTDKLKWIAENPFDEKEGFSFNAVLSLVSYDHYARKVVNALKLGGRNYIAENIGGLMGELFSAQMNGDELFIPVPMHKSKENKRGYNQADLLARYAARKCGCEYMKDALLKTSKTQSMRMSGEAKRKFVLENSIELNLNRVKTLHGRDIVLVDDVVTTGTTSELCARTLRFAGVGNITVLSFAVVGNKGK